MNAGRQCFFFLFKLYLKEIVSRVAVVCFYFPHMPIKKYAYKFAYKHKKAPPLFFCLSLAAFCIGFPVLDFVIRIVVRICLCFCGCLVCLTF